MLTNENRKTVPYSFRIDSEIYPLLENEARLKEISLNVLLNQIGKEHIFRQKFKKIGCVLTPKDVLREIFDGTDKNGQGRGWTELGWAPFNCPSLTSPGNR